MDRRKGNAAWTSNGHALESERIYIRIPPLSEYVRVVRNAADTVADLIHLPASDRAAMKLAVGEACNNAVIHSTALSPTTSAWVEVILHITSEALEIDVINPGTGFHPRQAARMPAPEAMAEQGRGIPLMEMLMDAVTYESRGGYTIVHMRRLRPVFPPTH
jgi:serine/threonine-protein kinase RsbW